jgi:hypothetical protein
MLCHNRWYCMQTRSHHPYIDPGLGTGLYHRVEPEVSRSETKNKSPGPNEGQKTRKKKEQEYTIAPSLLFGFFELIHDLRPIHEEKNNHQPESEQTGHQIAPIKILIGKQAFSFHLTESNKLLLKNPMRKTGQV